MYIRGKLKDFKEWHDAVKAANDIPPEGKIGYVNGQPAPQNQRTTAYVEAIQSPEKTDDYIWQADAHEELKKEDAVELSQEDVENLDWVK